MFKKASFLLLVLLNFAVSNIIAQSGKDGALTVSTVNTLINRYTRVTTDVVAGSNTVTVNNINELNRDGINYLPAGYVTNSSIYANNALGNGDLIILYQAQGAIIDSTNTSSYGDVTNYNGAGNYELAYVESVSGNTITLTCNAKLSYFAARYVQVIRVPQYTTLTVNSGASIAAASWGTAAFGGTDPSALQRRRGGFVAILADNIINNGSINANSVGFRGGTIENNSNFNATVFYTDYRSTDPLISAEKGESIAGYRDDYDNLYRGRYGRGAAANGGGGGNSHNSGGGGGSNGGDPANWFRGAGVMNDFGGTCGTPGAWTLDPNYIANGNALTNSAGGGSGGYTYSASGADACVSGPSYPAGFISTGVPAADVLVTAWGGDNRQALGGMGGRPIVSASMRKQIFFGGGGGAGDGNNTANNDGGDGGGIVFLVVSGDVSGTGIIEANGENGANTKNSGNDAPGGGGGGGTVLIQSASIANTVSINANGGSGGNQIIATAEAEGPGGGGGGGVIAVNATTDNSTKTADGGQNGRTTSTSLTEFLANGATSGNTGSITSIAVNLNFLGCNSISGTVLDDADGLTNNQVDGTGTNAGGLNAVLIDDETGNVVGIAPVQADGTYILSRIPPGDYSLRITTDAATLGNTAPAVTLPSGWINIGEIIGTGTGSDGTTDGIISLGTVGADLSNVVFGIEQLPTSDDATANNQVNPGGTNTVNVPTLTGSDPEDGTYTGTGNSNTIVITTIPSNGILYYNGVAVAAGDTIKNYNPTLLTLDPNDGLITVTFNFTQIDAAGNGSATDGVVNIVFGGALPVRFSSFTAVKINNYSSLLKWSTAQEINSNTFEIERSADGVSFETIGSLKASGNSNSVINYSFTDNAALPGNNFYRIKQVDIDGHTQYSDIVLVKMSNSELLVIYPNPSVNEVTIRFPSNMVNKAGLINLLSAEGKLISQKRVPSINVTEKLSLRKCSSGNYIIQVITATGKTNRSIQVISN